MINEKKLEELFPEIREICKNSGDLIESEMRAFAIKNDPSVDEFLSVDMTILTTLFARHLYAFSKVMKISREKAFNDFMPIVKEQLLSIKGDE